MTVWPDIPYPAWRETAANLHQWLQIVGKFRLALTPWLNHSWHATFYVTPWGLTTSTIHAPTKSVEVVFDFVDHRLTISTSIGERRAMPLAPMSVAAFYAQFLDLLRELDLEVAMHGSPNELAAPVPFATNDAPGAYDADAVRRFAGALVQIDRVFQEFRTGFIGKSSPVHLFWGSFDLAVTRFSGRRAPLHPGGVPALPDSVTHEAYSHEVSSAGFWPGGGGIDEPAFYAYAYPTPAGFSDASVQPKAAYYHQELGEFVLPYNAVRRAADPDATLLTFLQSTFKAAARHGDWDQLALVRSLGELAVPPKVEA